MQARSWARSLGPPLPAPDPFLHRRLRLTDAWLDQRGGWTALADHSDVELWTILGYLRWHAPALREQDPMAPARDPDAYLATQPLVAAIDAELARRGAIAAGEALAVVRALGLAPWEVPSAFRRRADRRPAPAAASGTGRP